VAPEEQASGAAIRLLARLSPEFCPFGVPTPRRYAVRKSTGQVIAPDGKRQRSWALRFTAYGKRRFVTLGREGWNRQRAEEELANVLADVRRGIWQPGETAPAPEPEGEPTFHEFAADWLRSHEPGLRPKTVVDYRWALELHLLPTFASYKLSEITAEEIDRYRADKLREGNLGANAINKTITRLAQILEVAVEYGRLESNPAKSRRRRAKSTEPRRSWVEPEQLPALLEAADEFLRPVVATLAGAGLRIGEAVALDWSDVDLATGTITVRESKTAAGEGRQVDMPVGLQEELSEWKARSPVPGRSDPVFVSRLRDGKHSRQTERNVQARLKTAIEAANAALEEDGGEQISERVSPHSLRRLYASLRAALRDDPVYIAEQLGHRDPGFTFRVYQRAAKRRERLSGSRLAAFDRAMEWAKIGAAEQPISEPVPSEEVAA
jgi:integrase